MARIIITNLYHKHPPCLSAYTSTGPSVCPWSSDSIRWAAAAAAAAGLIWLSLAAGQSWSWISLKSKLHPNNNHFGQKVETNPRTQLPLLPGKQPPNAASPGFISCLWAGAIWTKQPLTLEFSLSLSAFINLAEIMCFSSLRLSISAFPCRSPSIFSVSVNFAETSSDWSDDISNSRANKWSDVRRLTVTSSRLFKVSFGEIQRTVEVWN